MLELLSFVAPKLFLQRLLLFNKQPSPLDGWQNNEKLLLLILSSSIVSVKIFTLILLPLQCRRGLFAPQSC